MSETGLWRNERGGVCVPRYDGSYVVGYFSSYGEFVEQSRDAVVPEGFVSLVPQTEVDAANAEADRQRGHRENNYAWAERIEYKADGLEVELAEAIRQRDAAYATRDEWESEYERVKVHADYLSAELEGAEARIARLEDDLANADAELEGRQVAPSLPAVDTRESLTPAIVRLVSSVFRVLHPADLDSTITHPQVGVVRRAFDVWADRLEAMQAKQTEHEKLTEQVAKTIYESDRDAGLQPEGQEWNPNGLDHRDYDANAAALLARFNITLKEES